MAKETGKWEYLKDGEQFAFSETENKIINNHFEKWMYENKANTNSSQFSYGSWDYDFMLMTITNQTSRRTTQFRRVAPDVDKCPYLCPIWRDSSYLQCTITSPTGEVTKLDGSQYNSSFVSLYCFYDGSDIEWKNYNMDNNSRKWVMYGPAEQKAAEISYKYYQKNQEKKSYSINSNYAIYFHTMIQFRIQNPKQRRFVERFQYCWFWKHDDGTWIPYDSENSKKIETAFLNHETEIFLEIRKKIYLIHLLEMCQFHRTNRFRRREIYRIGPNLVKPRERLRVGSVFIDPFGMIPGYWKVPFDDDFEVIPLEIGSEDFSDIENLMNSTIGKNGHGNKFGLVPGKNVDPNKFQIVKISRVQSLHLWKSYIYEKTRILNELGKKLLEKPISKYISQNPLTMPLLDKSANEYYLFHGTNRDTIEKIVMAGFDPRKSNSNNMFGSGLYFAENSSKSNQYVPCPNCGKGNIGKKPCQCDPETITQPYVMLISRVMLGNAYLCKNYDPDSFKIDSKGLETFEPIPKTGCDLCEETEHDSVFAERMSFGGSCLSYREFIVYNKAQTYPEYIIYYNRLSI